MAKQPIINEALLDLKKIQDALNANTKEILRSVAREEIDGLVKESLTESGYEEEDAEDNGDETESPAVGPQTPDAGTPSGTPEDDSDVVGDEPEIGASDDAGIPAPDSVDPMGQDGGMDAGALGGDELDMTGASDDDVIAIYKKLSGEDEIEVVGDELHINITEPGQYIIKQGGGAPAGGDDMGGIGEPEMGSELGDEAGAGIGEPEGAAGDEPTYEIDMDDDGEGSEEAAPEGDAGAAPEASAAPAEEKPEEEKEKEPFAESEVNEDDAIKEEDNDAADDDVVEESIPVGLAQAHRLPGKADIGQPRGAGAKTFPTKEAVASKKPLVSEAEVKYKKLLTEAQQLKNENEEFREALKKFRSMLVETVVFNANLSYVTKLFMEHSTTKDEKKNIIQRFDSEVTNLKESKRLYKEIASSLTDRKPVNEAVENKIIKEVTTGSSKQLNEATAYVDPSTQRIKDLINRVENKDKY